MSRRNKPKPVYPARQIPLLPKPIAEGSVLPVSTSKPIGKLLFRRNSIPTKKVPVRSKSTSTNKLPRGRCGISLCLRPICTLVSHRRFAKICKERHLSSSTNHDTYTEPPLEWSIAHCDGLQAVQIEGLDQQIPRRLYHDYFTNHFERFHTVLNPPRGSSSNRKWMEERKRLLLGHGAKDHIDCLNLMVLTWTVMAAHRDTYIPETAGVVLCGRLINLVRRRLNDYTKEDSVRLLMIMYTLVAFDVVIQRKTALLSHREAMIHIVDSRGGLHNHGNLIPFIISLDRTIAGQTDQVPVYQTWASISLPIQRPARFPSVYGSFFDSESETKCLADSDIVGYCTETCRAIEILEAENWTFQIDNQATSEIYYLFYLRDRLTGKYVHLNARHCQTLSRDRCILFATKIVEYITLTDNMLPSIPNSIANTLRQVICLQNIARVWKGWDNVLRWIVCVLVSMPHLWKGKDWAVSLLHSLLKHEYGNSWPVTWQQDQICTASLFVWSTVRLNESFIGNSRLVTEVE